LVGSQAIMNPELGPTVHIASSVDEALSFSPQVLYAAAEFLVVDNYPWKADFELLRSGIDNTVKPFKAPFNDKPVPKEITNEVARLWLEADELFARLYPKFIATDLQGSYRPMVTKNEPMHFDTRPAAPDIPFVTSFINFATTPRHYCIGPNLYWLCQHYPKLMAQIWQASKPKADVSFELRVRTMKDKPPLDSKAPKHKVALAPGAIWFFDAKTVSHEVVYGEGAIARSWTVPFCGALQQPQILKQFVQ
jgi:hypothetical protein